MVALAGPSPFGLPSRKSMLALRRSSMQTGSSRTWRLLSSLLSFVLVASFAAAASAQTPRPKRKGKTLKVTIDSSPQGATIYLDSKEYGVHAYTPWTGKLTKGSWTVILEKDGF